MWLSVKSNPISFLFRQLKKHFTSHKVFDETAEVHINIASKLYLISVNFEQATLYPSFEQQSFKKSLYANTHID